MDWRDSETRMAATGAAMTEHMGYRGMVIMLGMCLRSHVDVIGAA